MTEFSLERKYRRLINGRLMTCPRCKKEEDILRFKPMSIIEEYARDTTVIYKCIHCRWLFAPADDIVVYLLGRSNSENGDS